MTLDAWVFCDCLEKGRLREPPPPGCRLAVAGDGSLVCESGDFFVRAAFRQWLYSRACGHENGVLIHHSIGDTGEIRQLRAALGQLSERYHVLRSQVVLNARRAESIVAPEQLSALRAEVIALGDIRCGDREKDDLIRRFELQMIELVECATFANKPVVFRSA
jgi:hypothetical protein